MKSCFRVQRQLYAVQALLFFHRILTKIYRAEGAEGAEVKNRYFRGQITHVHLRSG